MSIQPSTPQPDLFTAPPEDISTRWLEGMLKGAACWMTASDISMSTHGRVSDRDLRALASASEWIISGQKGYKHIEHATVEENAHASNWLISQGKAMIKRGCRIRRNAHRRIG
jgi:hypothetical protein